MEYLERKGKREMMESVLAGLAGDTWGRQTYGVSDFRDDAELLAAWGQVCRRSFTWSPSPGDTFTVYSAKHPTPEAANAQARKLALEQHYIAPKWWQVWRWRETPLP